MTNGFCEKTPSLSLRLRVGGIRSVRLMFAVCSVPVHPVFGRRSESVRSGLFKAACHE